MRELDTAAVADVIRGGRLMHDLNGNASFTG